MAYIPIEYFLFETINTVLQLGTQLCDILDAKLPLELGSIIIKLYPSGSVFILSNIIL